MYVYLIHGIRVHSYIDLGLPELSRPHPDIINHLTLIEKTSLPETLGSPVWESPVVAPSGAARLCLHTLSGRPLLSISDVGFFHFSPHEVHVYPTGRTDVVPFLLGRVFALWLQLAGTQVLHGSCLTRDGASFGLLAQSGTGKSTLATALSERGWALVTDDLIPLEPHPNGCLIRPGLPFSRLWPDTGRRFFAGFEHFPRVHPDLEKRKVTHRSDGSDRFCREARILTRLIILERSEPEHPLEIEALTGARALTTLIGVSYRPDPLEPLGLQGPLMEALSRVVERVPVFLIRFPSGFDRLDEVCDAIERLVSDQARKGGRKIGDLLVGTDP